MRPPASQDRIRSLCDYIDQHSDEPLTLRDLSARAGVSPFHLQRSFKAAVGMSPRQYLQARRMQAFKAKLKAGQDVTAAIYDAGFGSSSRVYERTGERLGMTPGEYRRAGRDLRITYVSVPSPVGRMMIAATDRGLCFLEFGETEEELFAALREEYAQATLEPMRKPYPKPFRDWMDALSEHLAGNRSRLDLPVDIQATVFQMRVWRYLQSIPYGEVRTYRQVAEAIGAPTASRAVGSACASNPVSIVIPCHRVIRGDGGLGGYRWGLGRKRALIERERAARTSE